MFRSLWLGTCEKATEVCGSAGAPDRATKVVPFHLAGSLGGLSFKVYFGFSHRFGIGELLLESVETDYCPYALSTPLVKSLSPNSLLMGKAQAVQLEPYNQTFRS